MSSRDEPFKPSPVLPIVDAAVIKTIRALYDLNQDFGQVLMARAMNEDQSLAHQLIIEAERQSDDINQKSSFIAGALFMREIISRSSAIDNVRKMFEHEEMLVSEDSIDKPDKKTA